MADQFPARITRTSPSPVRELIKERIVEHVGRDVHSPRSSHDTLLIEPSPRYRSRSGSRHRTRVSETDLIRTISRSRSRSDRSRHSRLASPVRIIDRHDDWIEPDTVRTGPLAIVSRPRSRSLSSDRYFLDDDRYGGYDLIRDTKITDSSGDQEEILEVKKDRRGRMSLVRRK